MKTIFKMALGILLLSLMLIVTPVLAYPDNVKTPTVQMPLITCWYKGVKLYYLQTDASDLALATSQGANCVPILTNAIAANAVDDIYHVTNYNQANVVPSAPIPAGPGNTDPNYTPLWQVSLVTWNAGKTPYTLTSEDAVLAAKGAGLVTIVKTSIVVNCPIVYSPQGGALPNIDLSIKKGTVEMPLIKCWYDGLTLYYLQTDASDSGLATSQGANYVPILGNAAGSGTVDDIYHVDNYNQANIVPSAPIPAGPNNANPNYSPIWQVSIVHWISGTPHTLKSEDEVLQAESRGLVTVSKTGIVVNCPIVYSPQGGALPNIDLSIPHHGGWIDFDNLGS